MLTVTAIFTPLSKVDLQPSIEQLKILSATFDFKRSCSQSAQKRRRLVFYWLRIDHRPLALSLIQRAGKIVIWDGYDKSFYQKSGL
jgi:hypothetical protein